jgi:hypothetical protein
MNSSEYEKALTEKLLYEFPPPAFRVIHNQIFIGKYSGGKRQIDVAVFRDGESDPFLVAEAKLHKDTIDINHVDAFITKIKDVNAKIGIMVVSSKYTKSQKKLAKTFDIELRIMTIEEALEAQWLSVARHIFPLDWAFHPQIAAGLYRLQKNESPSNVLEAIENIPFDEWMSLVQYAINKHPLEVGNFLWFVTQDHPDDGWRFNAIQELITSGLIKLFDVNQILQHQNDPEILYMLQEYGYS